MGELLWLMLHISIEYDYMLHLAIIAELQLVQKYASKKCLNKRELSKYQNRESQWVFLTIDYNN